MRKNYSIYDITGKILLNVTCDESEIDINSEVNNGFGYIEGTFDWNLYYIDLNSSSPVAFPTKTDNTYTWNWSSLSWEDARTLQDFKDVKLKEISEKLNSVLNTGYLVNSGSMSGKYLQTREEDKANWLVSQNMYKQAVNAGYGSVENAFFRTSDNMTFTISFQEGLDTLNAMAEWGSAVMRNSWTLKDLVNVATTIIEVEAIDVESGW